MKILKKIATVLVACVMAFALMLPVSAANTNAHTITITNKYSGHTYEAYQVFAGDLSGTKLTNIEWGTGVDGEKLLTALKADETIGSKFANCSSAEAVAKVLATFGDDSEALDAFAEIVGGNLTTVAGTSTESSSPYKINVTGDGYYLVKDKDGSIPNEDTEDAYTKYILKVVGDVTVNAKADVPSIDKVIVENSTDVKYNNAGVGQTVNYKVTSHVPNMDGYDKYYFIVTDKLSNGLTLNYDVEKLEGITVTIDGGKLENGKDYFVELDGQTFTIVFNNFIQYKDQTDDEIVITYSATINENAVIGEVGNPNEVKLTYSNNPNCDYEGENYPIGDDPVGETPWDKVITYVTKIELLKVDGKNNTIVLSGAKFTITGNSIKKVKVTSEVFTESTEGNYYLLNDGTYTQTAPTNETASLYKSVETKYVRKVVEEWVEVTENVTATAVTGDDGKLIFSGLGAGTYEITEIKAPDGYNLLNDSITVVISWAEPTDSTEKCIWSAKVDEVGATVFDGIIQMTVVNNSGTVLPSTGGMGTTVFYIVGGVLVVGAAILLISKKRMNGK